MSTSSEQNGPSPDCRITSELFIWHSYLYVLRIWDKGITVVIQKLKQNSNKIHLRQCWYEYVAWFPTGRLCGESENNTQEKAGDYANSAFLLKTFEFMFI
jgi:hypothetical protein